MARREDRENARQMRAKGKSYSEIRARLKVSKGTLSVWLHDMPLSPQQIRLLRDLNPRRIENYRATMARKREAKFLVAYEQAKSDIGTLSERELFLSGLYLYWGEGTKSSKGVVAVANTDPSLVLSFLEWFDIMGVPRSRLKVRLHLYKDMNIQKEMYFWS